MYWLLLCDVFAHAKTKTKLRFSTHLILFVLVWHIQDATTCLLFFSASFFFAMLNNYFIASVRAQIRMEKCFSRCGISHFLRPLHLLLLLLFYSFIFFLQYFFFTSSSSVYEMMRIIYLNGARGKNNLHAVYCSVVFRAREGTSNDVRVFISVFFFCFVFGFCKCVCVCLCTCVRISFKTKYWKLWWHWFESSFFILFSFHLFCCYVLLDWCAVVPCSYENPL